MKAGLALILLFSMNLYGADCPDLNGHYLSEDSSSNALLWGIRQSECKHISTSLDKENNGIFTIVFPMQDLISEGNESLCPSEQCEEFTYTTDEIIQSKSGTINHAVHGACSYNGLSWQLDVNTNLIETFYNASCEDGVGGEVIKLYNRVD